MKRMFCVVSLMICGFLYADDKILPPDAGVPVIDWKDAGQHLDKRVIVQGRIVATRNIGSMCFLNFDSARSFTAVVREPSYKHFPEPPEQMYDNQIVRIRGVISEYNGKPQIEVARPEQITLLKKEEPIPPLPPPPKARPYSGTVTVAAFNTLNLFDEYDDPYHEDEGTPAKPKEELDHLAAAIHALDADVLCLAEVENRWYLERFVAAKLADMAYQEVVCFEGNDHRGIDCTVLSRFPVGPVTSYRHLHFSDDSGGKTQFQRDFLHVEVPLPGGPTLHVFPVHFKSKRGGEESTEKIRLAEARQARKILDDLLIHEKDALVVVCGDFNDTWDSAPLKAIRGEGQTALQAFFKDVPEKTPTFNRGQHLDMIDFILASPALAKCYVPKSYKVIVGTLETLGSDHNPVMAKFKLK